MAPRAAAGGGRPYARVATAVLTNGGRILLVRRSMRMGTMPGLWACVSGVIEGGEAAVDRALAEIREEVGMGAGDVALLRAGEPLLVDDPAEGMRPRAGWEVLPFLFEARSRRVRLNWENDEHVWVRRGGLGGYETVPRLGEVVGRLMGEPWRGRRDAGGLGRGAAFSPQGGGNGG